MTVQTPNEGKSTVHTANGSSNGSSESYKPTVAVIGAGIAGLTAAYDLAKMGFRVSVFEENSYTGGRMTSVMSGSFMRFTGAVGLFRFYDDMWDLIDKVGLTPELVMRPSLGAGIADNGRQIYPLDFSRTLGMLIHPGLTLWSRLRLANLIPDFMRARYTVDPNLVDTAADFDDESMSEYLRRKVGADFLENVVGVVYRNLWAWNAEQISRAYFLMVYPHLRGRPSYTFSSGPGALVNKLASLLDVKVGWRADRIGRASDGDGRSIDFTTADGKRETVEADIVVCAVPGDKVKTLVSEPTDWEHELFSNVKYAQYVMVMYVLRRPLVTTDTASQMRTRAVNSPISFVATFPGSSLPGDPPRVWAIMAPERALHYVNADGSNLDTVMRHHLRKLYPHIDDDIVETHEMYDSYRIATFPTGQPRRVRSFLASQEAGPKNIYYVGDYLSSATAGGACAIARRTARHIAQHWL